MIHQRQAAQSSTSLNGQENDYLEELRNDHLGLVGGSTALVGLRDLIRRVAPSRRPVLISGPSGAGKSLVADAISRLSGRDEQGPGKATIQPSADAAPNDLPPSLARVNCRELDERSLEHLLFGTEREPGLLGKTDLATLVLDDVDALPESLQAKMVRLLQTGIFRPLSSVASGMRSSSAGANGSALRSVGTGMSALHLSSIGTPERRVAIRVLAVTSRSLPRCVRENTFRADLLYELGVLTVSVPGLDEHRDDIPALVNHFLRLAGSPLRLSPEALDVLTSRAWPGGVRELRNLVERAVVQTRDHAPEHVIGADEIRALCAPEAIEGTIERSLASLAERLLDLPVGNKLAAVEAALLASAMRVSRGNKSAAARLLGLHRKAVERKLEKYEVRLGGEEAGDEGGLDDPNHQEVTNGRDPGVAPVRDREIRGRLARESLHFHT